jgi:uncharacterized LabA/DUF88 family protein
MDVAVLVTGDGDFVPLVRNLMKNGIRVLVAHFKYDDTVEKSSYVNKRLIDSANYVLNINDLETDRDFKAEFKTIFRQKEENHKEKLKS